MDGTRPPILETSDTPLSAGDSPLVFQERTEPIGKVKFVAGGDGLLVAPWVLLCSVAQRP